MASTGHAAYLQMCKCEKIMQEICMKWSQNLAAIAMTDDCCMPCHAWMSTKKSKDLKALGFMHVMHDLAVMDVMHAMYALTLPSVTCVQHMHVCLSWCMPCMLSITHAFHKRTSGASTIWMSCMLAFSRLARDSVATRQTQHQRLTERKKSANRAQKNPQTERKKSVNRAQKIRKPNAKIPQIERKKSANRAKNPQTEHKKNERIYAAHAWWQPCVDFTAVASFPHCSHACMTKACKANAWCSSMHDHACRQVATMHERAGALVFKTPAHSKHAYKCQ